MFIYVNTPAQYHSTVTVPGFRNDEIFESHWMCIKSLLTTCDLFDGCRFLGSSVFIELVKRCKRWQCAARR